MSKLKTGPVVLSYPNLFTPKANDEGKLKYSTQVFLAYPGRDDIDEAEAIRFVRDYYEAAVNAAEKKWPGKGAARVKAAAINTREMAEGGAKRILTAALGELQGKVTSGISFKFGLRADRGKDGEKFPEACLYFSSNTEDKPGVVSRYASREDPKKPEKITDPAAIYGGVVARVSGNVFAYEAKGNTGISFGLGHVQKFSDGKRMDSRTSAEDDFDAEMEAELAFGGDNPVDADSVLG